MWQSKTSGGIARLAVLHMLFVLLVLCATRAQAKVPRNHGAPIGALAPLFALDTLDGRRIELKHLRGRALVLVVGLTRGSAPRCRRWMEALVPQAARRFQLYQVVVADKSWYITRSMIRSKLRGFVHPLHHWRVLIEWYTVFARQYGLARHDDPVILVIDARGVLRAKFRRRFSAPALQGVLAPLGQAPSIRPVPKATSRPTTRPRLPWSPNSGPRR